MLDYDEFKAMNNQLVVPAYRQFCRENALKFHFWDELPEGSYNHKVAGREFPELHKEAMELFNHLKPPFHIFRDRVVSFYFTSWAGDISYSAVPLEEFLRTHSRLEEVEKRCESLFGALVSVLQLVFVVIVFVLLKRWMGTVWFWAALAGGVVFGRWVCKWFIHIRPAKRKEREAEKLRERLDQLRSKLNEEQNGRGAAL